MTDRKLFKNLFYNPISLATLASPLARCISLFRLDADSFLPCHLWLPLSLASSTGLYICSVVLIITWQYCTTRLL